MNRPPGCTGGRSRKKSKVRRKVELVEAVDSFLCLLFRFSFRFLGHSTFLDTLRFLDTLLFLDTPRFLDFFLAHQRRAAGGARHTEFVEPSCGGGDFRRRHGRTSGYPRRANASLEQRMEYDVFILFSSQNHSCLRWFFLFFK